ncbi:MAG TPA: glycosyl transferase family 2 [Flavobacteriales bacterium]|nr:glycosyl transferase family 2 [Flavobacteriales bacterium]
MLIKFIKFGVVGFSGMIVDFGITYLFKEIFKIQKFVANAIGFLTAASSNYIFNRIWTFHSANPDVVMEFGKFFFVSVIGLGINSLVLWVLNTKFNLNFYFAKLLAIIVTTLWNFIANYIYTFTI